jgi:hypothetical protein
MRIIGAVSGLWVVANLLLFAGPQLYGWLTGWYTYLNPAWMWYAWLLGPPAVLVLLRWAWRLLRRRRGDAAA